MRLGLFMFNKKILLRRYDEVLMEEYREYLDYMALLKKLFAPETVTPDEEQPDEEQTKENQKTKKKGKKNKKGKNAAKEEKEKKGGGGGDEAGTRGGETARKEEPVMRVKTPPDFLKNLLT